MPEFLTTKELAELLRVKERTVYDLAASGDVPCTKVMGKLLFPRRAVDAWLAAHSQGGAGGGTAAGPSGDARRGDRTAPPPMVFFGSHDPVLDWALREARSGVATYFDGSADGLARLAAGEGVAAGLHLYAPETEDWNLGAVTAACADRPFVLTAWARRRRGLVVSEACAGSVSELGDIRGRRVAARQAEAGAQRLFDHLLAQAGLGADDYDIALEARSEADAVMAVASGRADLCFGLEAVAHPYRLRFIPIIDEQFDLLVERRAWFEPPLQAFFDFCRSAAFRSHVNGAAGYDASDLGRVRWNGP